MRKDLEAHVRGVLKTFGIRMAAIHRSGQRRGFRDQLARAGQSDLAIELMADAFNPIHKALCAVADAMEDALREIARGSDLAQRLMTVRPLGSLLRNRLPGNGQWDPPSPCLTSPHWRTKRASNGHLTSETSWASPRGDTNLAIRICQAGSAHAGTGTCGDCSVLRGSR